MTWQSLTKSSLIVVLSVMLGSARCPARIVTVEITAEITEFTDETGFFIESFQLGDQITGTYAYDTSVPDSSDIDRVGRYWMRWRPAGISLSINGVIFKTDPENCDIPIEIHNNANFIIPLPPDQFILTSRINSVLPAYPDLQYGIEMFFAADCENGHPTAIEDDCLPETAPNLDAWDIKQIEIAALTGRRGLGSKRMSVKANITSARLLLDPAWVFHVRSDADYGGDGLSWFTPYRSLQNAIQAAPSVGNVVIRVAQGLYRPDNGQGLLFGDPKATFRLFSGVTIEGGYTGLADQAELRNADLYPTVLSGVLTGDSLLDHGNELCRSRHIVTARNVNPSAILDGCIIRGGYADFCPQAGIVFDMNQGAIDCNACGGGMLLVNAAPLIRNCTFEDNYAAQHGGAVCSIEGRIPNFIDCEFVANRAQYGGGGVYAGVDRHLCTLTLGRLYCANDSGIHAVRCLFEGNTAGIGGAAFYSGGSSTLDNCTLVGNQALQGPGIALWSDDVNGVNHLLRNCILQQDGCEINLMGTADVNVVYSNVEGGWPGLGNIDGDPYFVASGYWHPNSIPEDPYDDYWVRGDYHLRSGSGHWDKQAQSWINDDFTSPCIDTGDPNTPVGYEPMPNGDRINMGIYGGTPEASRSYPAK